MQEGVFSPRRGKRNGACPVPSCSHIMGLRFAGLPASKNGVLLYGTEDQLIKEKLDRGVL